MTHQCILRSPHLTATGWTKAVNPKAAEAGHVGPQHVADGNGAVPCGHGLQRGKQLRALCQTPRPSIRQAGRDVRSSAKADALTSNSPATSTTSPPETKPTSRPSGLSAARRPCRPGVRRRPWFWIAHVGESLRVAFGPVVCEDFTLMSSVALRKVRTASPMVLAREGMPLAPKSKRYTTKMKTSSLRP